MAFFNHQMKTKSNIWCISLKIKNQKMKSSDTDDIFLFTDPAVALENFSQSFNVSADRHKQHRI